ncbi:MAG: hypothetical protein IJV61_03650 [Paludibacteraceae bacterium]|nr:hypothetical protein [Paludibacteraceae bacterium]
MKQFRYIVLLLLVGMVGQGCSSRAIHEAEAVVAQADSLWQEGLMYGIDAGDSLTLAQAYETLSAYQFLSPFAFHPSSSFTHACYHYGKLLRAKDDPEEAMRCFINATRSRTRDYHILGRVYSNMGSICHLAGEFQLSYDMYERSANCFLADNDSLSYYFLLNDMAFELAEQGQKDSCFNIIANIKNHASYDSVLLAYCWITQAQACLKCKQYDSLIFYAQQSKQIASTLPSSSLQLAQAYSYLGERDSATYYALFVLNYTNELFDVNNALYILTNDDISKDKDAIRETAAARSDTQKILEIRQGKMSQAVQLLEQDLNYSPDLTWLYVLIATLILVGATLGIYVYCKQKKQALLSQKIDKLEKATSIIQEKHDELSARYSSNYNQIKEDIDHKCTLLHDSKKIKRTLAWKKYHTMCTIVDKQFYMLASKLQSKQLLNETEIRLCILTLLDCGYDQMAELLYYAPNGIGKLKLRVAKKLGTSAKGLRSYLIENECVR